MNSLIIHPLYKSIEKWGVINDLHIPYHDHRAVMLAIDIMEDQDVDVLVLNGDIADFGNISRHGKKTPDLNCALEDEFYALNNFFDMIRKRFINRIDAKHPRGRKVIYRLGNHEVWLDIYISENCPAFWNYLRIDKMINLDGFEIHQYNEDYRIRETLLKLQHSPPSYAKAGPHTALTDKRDFSFLWGCTHRIGHATATGDSGQVYHGWFNGWLGNQEYTKLQKIAFKYKKNHRTWQQGASIVTVIRGKEFFNQQFTIENYKACVGGECYEG